MIKAPDHAKEVTVIFTGGTSVNEKRFVHFRSIDCQGNVICCVGTKSPGIFVAISRYLSKCKPNALLTVNRLIVARRRLRRRLNKTKKQNTDSQRNHYTHMLFG